MRKNRLEHYAVRRTITFNINKITKYESPAAECPRTLLYFKRVVLLPAPHPPLYNLRSHALESFIALMLLK